MVEFYLSVRGFLRASEQFVTQAGLTPMEFDLLVALRACPQATSRSIARLSERLLTHHHVAAGAVGRLVEKELLKTERNMVDRRSLTLSMTARGEALLEEIALRTMRELELYSPQIMGSLATLIN